MSGLDMSVKVKRNDSREVEKALKKLKRKMDDEGIIQDMRNRQCYKKPSVKDKEKKAAARKRRAKELRFSK